MASPVGTRGTEIHHMRSSIGGPRNRTTRGVIVHICHSITGTEVMVHAGARPQNETERVHIHRRISEKVYQISEKSSVG